MPAIQELYDELVTELRRVWLLGSCSGMLGWDRETHMPSGGAEHRANQLSLLAGLGHQWLTNPRVGELLDALQAGNDPGDPDGAIAVNVREAQRTYDRATKLPQRLVEEISRVTTLSQQAWIQARRESAFATFQPWLQQVVDLKREEAQAVGFAADGQPYDALLDEYEPGTTSADVSAAFTPLRAALVPLLAAIRDSSVEPQSSILTRRFPIDSQERFGRRAAAAIGFDFDRGRLDVTAHPFCSGIGPGDCRLTTRYDAHHFPGAFFGTLHEAGHGIYEQGLDPDAAGTAMGEAVSLGIHESQSRMWENFVGRSHAFWQYFYADAQKAFSEALSDVSLEDFHAAINDVRASFIRVEADEVTYNLHIMLRFELEQPLITGDLQPTDLPAVWNEKFAGYFGITPDNDAQGCLQDIHWSAGLIGYFPTYALGNMYAAHFFNCLARDVGDPGEMFARGEFASLKSWLNENIHRRGKQYPAGRLLEVVTGKTLSHEPLVSHLHQKYEPLYRL